MVRIDTRDPAMLQKFGKRKVTHAQMRRGRPAPLPIDAIG